MVEVNARLIKYRAKGIQSPALVFSRESIKDTLDKGKFYKITFLSIHQDIIIHKTLNVLDDKSMIITLGNKVVGYLGLEFGEEYDVELIREDPIV